MDLHNCPLCRGTVSFHQDQDDCPSGCHYLQCAGCKTNFDLSEQADPDNQCQSLEDLRAKIEPLWNRQCVVQWNAYEQGWASAARWANRDDLLADIGSKAYVDDREKGLALKLDC